MTARTSSELAVRAYRVSKRDRVNGWVAVSTTCVGHLSAERKLRERARLQAHVDERNAHHAAKGDGVTFRLTALKGY